MKKMRLKEYLIATGEHCDDAGWEKFNENEMEQICDMIDDGQKLSKIKHESWLPNSFVVFLYILYKSYWIMTDAGFIIRSRFRRIFK